MTRHKKTFSVDRLDQPWPMGQEEIDRLAYNAGIHRGWITEIAACEFACADGPRILASPMGYQRVAITINPNLARGRVWIAWEEPERVTHANRFATRMAEAEARDRVAEPEPGGPFVPIPDDEQPWGGKPFLLPTPRQRNRRLLAKLALTAVVVTAFEFWWLHQYGCWFGEAMR